MAKHPELRVRLRAFLQAVHDRMEAADPTEERQQIVQLLAPVLSALDDLDHGQTPPVFEPTPSKRRTSRPVDERRLQLSAFRYEAALRRRGMKPEKARGEVADAYDVSVEAIKDWKKKVKLESEDEIAHLVHLDGLLERGRIKMRQSIPDVHQILKAAARDGKEYSTKFKPQKGKAKGKKKPP